MRDLDGENSERDRERPPREREKNSETERIGWIKKTQRERERGSWMHKENSERQKIIGRKKPPRARAIEGERKRQIEQCERAEKANYRENAKRAGEKTEQEKDKMVQ